MTVNVLVAEQVTGTWAEHGEGPIWDSAAGVLRWVDLLKGDILSWRPGDDEPIRWHVGDVAAAVRRRRSGGFVVATHNGFALLGGDGAVLEVLPPIWTDPSVRMNDGGCDPSGQFYCGSMAYDEAPGRGTLHRLNTDHTTTQILDDITISNGFAFSPDGAFAFHIDTPTSRVVRYTIDESGCFVEPYTVVEIPDQHGFPDGMSLDADGGFWIAMWDGSAVRHFGPEGELRDIVQVPVPRPTSCAFGGDDGHTLFITTSSNGGFGKDSGAGAVFAVRVPVAGPAEEFYAG